MAPIGVLRLRHALPHRLRLQVLRASEAEARALATRLGAEWHRWSGCLVLAAPPSLNGLAADLEDQGWWLEAPHPGAAAVAEDSPWGEVSLEVGVSLIGATLGEPLGRWLGTGLAGPPGAVAGSFLGLAMGAVLATEALQLQRRPSSLEQELNQTGSRIGSRVAGRLGEEAGALAGLRLGAALGGPLGASAGALLGTLVVGQLGEDAALHHTAAWRHPMQWFRQTGRAAAGEAASQNLFGLLGGALFQTPGRQAGERLGLYIGRRIDWQRLQPVQKEPAGGSGTADQQVGDNRKDHRIENK